MKKDKSVELSGVKEIARRANVSIGTVDRVIHNRVGVSAKTKKIIQDIIKELDYQPNILAQRLVSKKVLKIAILIPALSQETEFWGAPLNGIEQAEIEIRPYGIKIERYFFDLNDKKSFVTQTKEILKTEIDGLLLAPSFIEESIRFTAECKKHNIPYVLINSDLPENKGLCYIGPELFQSGYQSAHLINYAIRGKGKVLVVNISKEIDNHHHLLRKEEGFRAYFKDHQTNVNIIKDNITKTDYKSVAARLKTLFENDTDIDAIFVTNSRVASVARYLEESEQQQKFLLIGYDFLQENIEHLKSETIDFLICQKPQEQGYRGIMALYRNMVLKASVDENYFMPIDIITKENYGFYSN